jgi:hypothetical protein
MCKIINKPEYEKQAIGNSGLKWSERERERS